MRNITKFKSKNLFKFILLFSFLIFLFGFFLFQKIRTSYPQLSELAQRIGKPPAAFAFNYSQNIDKQLYLLSQNIGFENNPQAKRLPLPLPLENRGEIGGRGFFIMDINPQRSGKIFSSLDLVLNNILDFLDANNLDENSFYEYDKPSPQAELQNPLSALIEEMWNGQTLLIGGATQIHLSLKDSVLFLLEPYYNKIFKNSEDKTQEFFVKNLPLSIQTFLNNHAMGLSIKKISSDPDTQINHSQITFSILDPHEFLNCICSSELNPWDFCGRYGLSRIKFRENVQNIFSLSDNNFKLNFDIYWSLKGNIFVFSNQENFLQKMLDPNTPSDSNNIMTSVSSSGDDFLLSSQPSQKYSRISFLFDMIQIQNQLITFVESMKNQSTVLSDYFSSPAGDIIFSNIESKINFITSYSEKCSITLDSDGERILPEVRLFSPSEDIFANQRKSISPQVLTSARVLITQFLTLGHYFMPRGLIPLAEPSVQYNGKWAIIRTDIPVKSIAPYLQNVD